MKITLFRIAGALTDEHNNIYIERRVDLEAPIYLRRMDYLLIIEPRQQGKTSLVNHLMYHPGLDNLAFVYLDVTTPDRSSEMLWYQTLCPRILRQLRDFIPRSQRPSNPQNSAGWREFLCEIAICAAAARKRVVIALDEIGAVIFPGATEFFSVLREVYNSRQAESELKHLTFLLAGAFHPRDLIKDDKISPFNIAHRVRLNDFTLAQVRDLVDRGPWTDEQSAVLAKRIHYWTDGQPYLTQLLCSYLKPDAIPADVDAGIERLRREDENHLPPILKQLSSDEKLCRYIERILGGEQIRFYPQENQRQSSLELLGVIKEGPEGFCVIRNRLYKWIFIENEMFSDSNQIGAITSQPKPHNSPSLEERMNIKLGLHALKACIEHQVPDSLSEFHTLEDRIQKNERAERVFGSSENTRNERSQIIFALNELALECCDISFNAFCEGKQPSPAKPVQDQNASQSEVSGRTPVRVNSTSTSVTVPTELREQLQKGNIVLFCGAGISISDDGLPIGTQLAQELAERAGLGDVAGQSLPDVAQAYEIEMGHHSLIAYLCERIDQPQCQPLRSHHLVAALPFKRIITTNWDTLLEDAFAQAGPALGVIVRDVDVAYADQEKPLLIKLHGTIRQRDTLVITGDDYYEVFDRLPETTNLVRSYFAAQTVLFLGFSLADEDFKRLYREVVRSLGKHKRRAYAVQLDPDPITVKYWQRKNVEVIDADATAFLEALYAQLEAIESPAQPSVRPIGSGAFSQSGEILQRLQRIEEKLDAGRVEDRQVAAQLLDALEQNQVGQAEAAQMVTELRGWVQEVQQAGLPLNVEVREALHALMEHQGSAYQYLQLALPIIPGILSYNVELGSEHTVDLKGIWERIKVRFGKGSKGSAASGSNRVYHGIRKAWAVLVGINHYNDAFIHSLKVCVDDVTAVHQTLAGRYEVAKLLTDATSEYLPTRSNILGELSTVAQSASEDDLLLFYFSGHGMAQNGESYLMARDTRLSALKHTAVAMQDVRELIEQSPAHAKVIVLDACHSGASIGKAEPTMTPEFIQRVFEQAEGMAVLASCKENQQSWEWSEKRRSVFTYYLLDALTGKADFEGKGFVTVSDVSNYVTDGVKVWAANQSVPQTPTLQYMVAGDIILLRYDK